MRVLILVRFANLKIMAGFLLVLWKPQNHMRVLILAMFGNLKIIDGLLAQVVSYVAAVFLWVHCPWKRKTYISKEKHHLWMDVAPWS